MLLSPEDKAAVNWNWYITGRGYAMFTGGPRSLIHRWVIERKIGQSIPKGLVVDHINDDKLDNRRENLQLVSQSTNRLKGKSSFENKKVSAYRRVSFARNKWRTSVQIDNKLHTAVFDEERDAAIFADALVILMLDPQSNINFPELRNKEKLREELQRMNVGPFYLNLQFCYFLEHSRQHFRAQWLAAFCMVLVRFSYDVLLACWAKDW